MGTIASELGVHVDTVKLALGTATFVSRGVRPRSLLIEPYAAFIAQTLEQHPRLRSTRLYDMLEARGDEGSKRQLRRYVKKVRPRNHAREAYLRMSTLPGEQGQVDWGDFGTVKVAGGERRLSVFVLVLPWIRGAYARFTLDQDRRRADRDVPLAVPVPEHVRAKDVVVVPHDLGDYDQLSQGGEDGPGEQEEAP